MYSRFKDRFVFSSSPLVREGLSKKYKDLDWQPINNNIRDRLEPYDSEFRRGRIPNSNSYGDYILYTPNTTTRLIIENDAGDLGDKDMIDRLLKHLTILINEKKELSKIRAICRSLAMHSDELYRSGNRMAVKINIKVISEKIITPEKIHITITPNNYLNISHDLYRGEYSFWESNVIGSDVIKQIYMKEILSMEAIYIERKAQIREQDGKYFPFTNKTIIPLQRYQIFTKEHYHIKIIENIHCLLYALIEYYGPTLNNYHHELESAIANRFLPVRKLKIIAQIIGHDIKLRQYDKRGNIVQYNYSANKKFPRDSTIELAIFKGHYFIYEKTKYSKYSIKNYDKIKDVKDFHDIVGREKSRSGMFWRRRKERKLSSLALIKLMFEQNLFEPIRYDYDLTRTSFINKWDNTFDEIETSCREVYYSPRFNSRDFPLVVADFETFPDIDGFHKPYLICAIQKNIYTDNEETHVSFKGTNCAKQFLDWLPDKSMIYFHNLRFDFSFLIDYATTIKSRSIERNGALYKMEMVYNNKNFKFKDSHKLIPMKLKNFNSMFNLRKLYKDVMPYKYYDYKLFTKDYGLISKACEFLNDNDDQIQFMENIQFIIPGCFLGNDRFNYMIYAEFYCKKDCEVLLAGLLKMRESIKKITVSDFESEIGQRNSRSKMYKYKCNLGLDILDYVSISSIAKQYFLKTGCYEGVVEIKGGLREFCSKAIVGGRVCLLNNEKQMRGKIDENFKASLADLDAVSLYPSAYCRLNGFPIGKPLRLDNNDLEMIEQQRFSEDNYYIVEIVIKNIGKKRGIPCLSYIVNGLRKWTNDIIEDRSLVVDKITLEDLIKFQEIKFVAIRGVKWNKGFNTRCIKIMKKLFITRKKYKKIRNPIEKVYKLKMNSAYGSTILKPTDSTTKYFPKKDMHNQVVKLYNRIKSFTEFGNLVKFNLATTTFNHYNMPHCGAYILSMSKRMMNEVLYLAEDNGFNIYYMDTDSMHIDYDNIQPLAKLYQKKYNRKLLGSNIGQFHNDFPDGYEFSDLFICVAKKVYMDRIWTKERDKMSYHLRMKGFPKIVIDGLCEKEKIQYEKLYKNLYDGKSYSIKMSDFKTFIEIMPNGVVRNNKNFKRTISGI